MEKLTDTFAKMSVEIKTQLLTPSSQPLSKSSPVPETAKKKVRKMESLNKRLVCWSCGGVGHRRFECAEKPRSRSIEQPGTCGKTIHNTEQKFSARVASVKLRPPELGEEVVHLLAGEDLAKAQQKDPEIGPIVNLKLTSQNQPTAEELMGASKRTKQLVSQWNRLVFRQGIVYRLFSDRNGCQNILQLLVPDSLKERVLMLCHLTSGSGIHNCLRRTLDQIQRQFFWWTWRGDTAKYCRSCQECCSARRHKLLESAKQEPMVAAVCRNSISFSSASNEPESLDDTADECCSETEITGDCESYYLSPNTHQQSVEPVDADDDSGCSEFESDDCPIDMNLAIAKYKQMRIRLGR